MEQGWILVSPYSDNYWPYLMNYFHHKYWKTTSVLIVSLYLVTNWEICNGIAILEHTVPACYAIPDYLAAKIESVIKRVMKITPGLAYQKSLDKLS